MEKLTSSFVKSPIIGSSFINHLYETSGGLASALHPNRISDPSGICPLEFIPERNVTITFGAYFTWKSKRQLHTNCSWVPSSIFWKPNKIGTSQNFITSSTTMQAVAVLLSRKNITSINCLFTKTERFACRGRFTSVLENRKSNLHKNKIPVKLLILHLYPVIKRFKANGILLLCHRTLIALQAIRCSRQLLFRRHFAKIKGIFPRIAA